MHGMKGSVHPDHLLDREPIMAKSKTVARDIQRPFQIEEIFFSTTDRAGVIRSGNEVFRRVAAFDSIDDMIGKPHNIIRHPDMPRSVFKLFWDYLEAGKPVAAYVKNMAQDGAYYWVVALAVPLKDGYLSVRFKPSSDFFPLVRDLYTELLTIEKEHGSRGKVRNDGMTAAGERLLAALKDLGFEDYDEFMQTAMATEMGSRAEKIAGIAEDDCDLEGLLGARLEHCRGLDQRLDLLFKKVGTFLELIGNLQSKSSFLAQLAAEIHLLSLNSLIAAHHLSDDGKALAVVADDLAGISIQSADIIRQMEGDIHALIGGLRTVAFGISGAKLQVAMSIVFLKELIAGNVTNPDQIARDEQDLETLSESFNKSLGGITETLPLLQEPMAQLIRHLDLLAATIRALSRVHLIGKIEASHLGTATTFQQVFDEVYTLLSSGKQELEDFTSSISLLNDQLPTFTKESARLLRAA